MADPALIILYVDDVARSAAFYEALFGAPPAEASPGFARFPRPGGMGVGLWARGGVASASQSLSTTRRRAVGPPAPGSLRRCSPGRWVCP